MGAARVIKQVITCLCVKVSSPANGVAVNNEWESLREQFRSFFVPILQREHNFTSPDGAWGENQLYNDTVTARKSQSWRAGGLENLKQHFVTLGER